MYPPGRPHLQPCPLILVFAAFCSVVPSGYATEATYINTTATGTAMAAVCYANHLQHPSESLDKCISISSNKRFENL